MALNFAGQVWEAVENEKLRRTRILRLSLKLLLLEMRKTVFEGGRLPYDTGNLRRSILVSTTSMPLLAKEDIEFADLNGSNLALIDTLEPGTTAYVGYQAAYALRVNYGFTGRDALGRVYNQTGYLFYESIQARWPALVRLASQMVGNG